MAAPHMEELTLKAATKKLLLWIREHYFAKCMKCFIIAASKIMVTSGQNGATNDIVYWLHPIGKRHVIIVEDLNLKNPKFQKKLNKNSVQIYDKKYQNFPENKTQQKFGQQISEKQLELLTMDFDIGEQFL